MAATAATIDDVIQDFGFLDDWEDRYRYVIELGKALPAMPEHDRIEANKVRGCASQVWLVSEPDRGRDGEPALNFRGDSDAHIVRGLIAIVLSLYSGRTAAEVAALDPEAVFARIGLREHLSSQRSNGLSSMLGRIRSDARAMLAERIN